MCGHSEECIYKDKKLLYALMEVGENKIIIAASEMLLFDTYLEYAHDDDKNLAINYEESDNEPYQLVYGSILENPICDFNYKELANLAEEMKGYALLELVDENEIRVSGYDDILVLEYGKAEGNYPFVALMKTRSTFVTDYSKTMFPAGKCNVWESLVNRPFLLACRYSIRPDDLTIENWKSYVSEETMLSINEVADLYTGE